MEMNRDSNSISMNRRRSIRVRARGLSGVLCLLACLSCPPDSFAQLSDSRRTAIVNAVQSVLPATVTIGAERIAVQQVNPFRSLHDDFFSGWFSDPYFGSLRRAVRVKSLGSGILVSKRGLVLTNDHVVADAEDIYVTLSDGREFPAKLKGRGIPLDLAILEIIQPKDAATDLPFVTLGTADDLALGEWAIAIGAPSNLEASVTAGIISALGRKLPSKEEYKYLGMIQTDAAINPGNSGGPLVNADGKVVGINTVIISQSGGSEGLGFAIPADQARKVLIDLTEAGEVRMAWFGWELAESKAYDGLLVKSVHPSGEAHASGVRAGSVLRAVNDIPVCRIEDYERVLLMIRIGQTVMARIAEGGREGSVRLTARVMPESLLRVDLGLVVEDVSPRVRRQLGGGVVVTDIRAEGLFGKMESSPIQSGDIIIALNNQLVDSADGYEATVKRLRKNSTVEITFRRRNVLFTYAVKI